MIDLPPINVLEFINNNLPQNIIAVFLTVVIMATSRTPKRLFISSAILLVAMNVLVDNLWSLLQSNRTITTFVIASGLVAAYIWRENKPDVSKK